MCPVSDGKEKGYGKRKRDYQVFSKVIDTTEESKDLLSVNITFPEYVQLMQSLGGELELES